MTVVITHIRLSGTPEDEQHITTYKWRNPATAETGSSTKVAVVEWLRKETNKAYVGAGTSQVPVGVVDPSNGNPYLRTYGDRQWTNNLLALPRF